MLMSNESVHSSPNHVILTVKAVDTVSVYLVLALHHSFKHFTLAVESVGLPLGTSAFTPCFTKQRNWGTASLLAR